MYKTVVYRRSREDQEPNFCVFFNEKKEGFTYLLKGCKIYSVGNMNCLREKIM
jgi:hypothetical protein